MPVDLPGFDMLDQDSGPPESVDEEPTEFQIDAIPTASVVDSPADSAELDHITFPLAAADMEHSWTVVEHVQPDDPLAEEIVGEPTAEEEVADEPPAAAPIVEFVPPTIEQTEELADSEGVKELDVFQDMATVSDDEVVAQLPHRVPPFSKLVGFDSMMTGAKSALTGTHHQKPKAKPAVTVTLPSSEELESDVERDRSIRDKLVPLLTYRSGMFEEHLGTFVGVAAAFVVAIAGLLFVPQMLSDDAEDPEALASSQATSDSVHLYSSADAIGTAGEASLSVSTFPPGARVYLDSDLIGVTPFQGITVAQGLQAVSIKKSDFVSVDTMLEIGGSPSLYFELEADPSTQLAYEVDVPEDSRSSVAAVEPDDRSITRNRNTYDTRETSSQAIAATADVTPERRSSPVQEVRDDVRSTGAIVVTSEPSGASVFLNDRAVGETPLTITDLAIGKARVTMQREGYVPYETELNVMPSIQTPFHAVLARMKGRIEYLSEAGAELYVDGTLIQRSTQVGSVELVDAGQRVIRLVHPRYGEWISTLNVPPDQTTPIEVDLVDHAFLAALVAGDQLFSESRYAEAIEKYNEALSFRPGAGVVQNKLGLAAKGMTESGMPSADESGVYTVVDAAPQLIGGLEALHAHVDYPEEAYNAGVQGRVYVQFVVDENGRAQDLKIAKGLPMGCNDAAMRAIQRAKFTPGLVNRLPVKSRMTLFVNFAIN
jgi:protein TonB